MKLELVLTETGYTVQDSRTRVCFRGTEIDCCRFIIKTTMKVEKVSILEYPKGNTYRVKTNLGTVDAQQISEDSLYDGMFFSCDFGNVMDIKLHNVLVETLAWDLSYDYYCKEQSKNQLEDISPEFGDIHPTQFPE